MVKKFKKKAWRSVGDVGQLDVEGFQWCLANSSLMELIPQDDSGWEEALLVDGISRPDLAEARVVASSCASGWSQVWLYWYTNELMYDTIHHAESSRVSRFCRVSQPSFIYHLGDTTRASVVVWYEPCCPLLYHLDLVIAFSVNGTQDVVAYSTISLMNVL